MEKALKGDIDLAEIEPVASLAKVTVNLDEAVYMSRALELAVELDHPVYDCVYLAAAEALDATLVTADQRFLDRVAKTAFADRAVDLARWKPTP